MHTLSAFYVSQLVDTTDVVVSAVTDEVTQVRTGRYQFREKRQIRLGYAAIDSGVSLKLDYPSALKICTPVIDPIDADGVGGSLPALVDYGDRGLILPDSEDIGCLSTRAGSGTTPSFVGLWTTPQFVPAPQGPVWTIRGTAAVAAAIGVWGIGTLTLDRPLPKGRYAVIGMRATGANLLFARLSFYGQTERPGCIANISTSAYQMPYFRFGKLGLFGVFDNYLLPQLNTLGLGTTTTQAVSLDVVPLAA